jgi:hypothetical protein
MLCNSLDERRGVAQMPTDSKTTDVILSSLGVHLPVDLSVTLNAAELLEQIEHVLTLAAGERQRLGELLCAAERITPAQLDDALEEQQTTERPLGEILIKQGLLTQGEQDIALAFQRRQDGSPDTPGALTLGNILVSGCQITREQLDQALHGQQSSGRRLGEELIAAGHATLAQIKRGLQLQRKLTGYALAVAISLTSFVGLIPAAQAGQLSAAIPVSVTVLAYAKMQTEHQTRQLHVSEADIARGYVEINDAMRFSVNTNSLSGYLLVFHPIGNLFESVQVGGLDNAVQLNADGGDIVQRGATHTQLSHTLSFRFNLSQEVTPGNYPWPLQLSVRGL